MDPKNENFERGVALWNFNAEADALWAILSDPRKHGNAWDPEEFFQTGRGQIAALWDRLSNLNMVPSRGTALDFGCGVGRLTQPLASRFDRVVGTDISEGMIRRAESFNQFAGSVSYVVNARPELSQFGEGHFDFILSLLVLQHIPPENATRYIEEFLRILKPGGILVFQLVEPKPEEGTAPAGAHLKRWVKRLLPFGVMQFLRGRLRRDRPVLHMFGIDRKRVTALLSNHPTETTVDPDRGGGDEWDSYTYYVRKLN